VKTEGILHTVMLILVIISLVFLTQEKYIIAIVLLYLVLMLNIITMDLPDEK